MPEAALVTYAVYLGLVFGLRSLLQWRATGSTGFHGVSGRPGSLEWLAGVLFVVALVLGVAAPVLVMAGVAGPVAALDYPAVNWAGAALALAGTALTLYAQGAMGESWRIGVEQSERTELVSDGPFRLVRNPFFSAMMPAAVGLAMMVPSPVAIAGLVVLTLALELQVRVVEEPYLIRSHGSAYLSYAARTGRFVPGVGRIDPGVGGTDPGAGP
jgi:protein-S-isoprenylcysteine O-methyltransferase Ste14